MNKLTKGFLAAAVSGACVLGVGVALNASANEEVYDDNSTVMEDAVIIEDSINLEMREEGGYWEITGSDGNVIDSGTSNGGIMSTTITMECDEETGECDDITEINVESFETEEEFEAWLEEQDWNVDEE